MAKTPKQKTKCPECDKEFINLSAHMKAHKKVYTASAKVMGRTFEGKGETIYEAIGSIKTGGVAGMVILTVSTEDNKVERIIPHISAKRLFMTIGLTREVALEHTSKLFDGV